MWIEIMERPCRKSTGKKIRRACLVCREGDGVQYEFSLASSESLCVLPHGKLVHFCVLKGEGDVKGVPVVEYFLDLWRCCGFVQLILC